MSTTQRAAFAWRLAKAIIKSEDFAADLVTLMAHREHETAHD